MSPHDAALVAELREYADGYARTDLALANLLTQAAERVGGGVRHPPAWTLDPMATMDAAGRRFWNDATFHAAVTTAVGIAESGQPDDEFDRFHRDSLIAGACVALHTHAPGPAAEEHAATVRVLLAHQRAVDAVRALCDEAGPRVMEDGCTSIVTLSATRVREAIDTALRAEP